MFGNSQKLKSFIAANRKTRMGAFSRLRHTVVIASAARTPVGSFNGSLADVSATQLGSVAIKGVVDKAGIKPEQVDEVLMGNVVSAGLGQAPCRQAVLGAGLPEKTVCTTVNKVCASGMKTITMGAQAIALGDQDVVVAGGMESMSRAPYYVEKARFGHGFGHGKFLDSIINDGLFCAKQHTLMGVHAELCAKENNITREDQDAFAIQSYTRSAESVKNGVFADEIVPVTKKVRGKDVIICEDEEYTKVNFEKVPKLKPVFDKNGSVTAANSSTLNDGASAVLLMSEEKASELNVTPIGKIIAYADAECAPEHFPIAPSKAVPIALRRANLTIDQIALFEFNEAFSVVALANEKILGLDPSKVNIAGGAVSLGHPIGSSGCRIVVTLLHLLKSGEYGCAAICNGGGGATALIVQKL